MEPDHTKLGADLSLMSFLKSGPTRRGVVNAINPMMPISTSEVSMPINVSCTQNILSLVLQMKSRRVGEPPKEESVKAPTKKSNDTKNEAKTEQLSLAGTF